MTLLISLLIVSFVRVAHDFTVRKFIPSDLVCRKGNLFTKKKSTWRVTFRCKVSRDGGIETLGIRSLGLGDLTIFPCNSGVGVPKICCALSMSAIVIGEFRIRLLAMICQNWSRLGQPSCCCNFCAPSAPSISHLLK